MTREQELGRRHLLKLAAAAVALGTTAASAEEPAAPLPKTKIGPPPGSGLPASGTTATPPMDEGTAEDLVCSPDMVGLSLRVVGPGQMVTQEYDARRLTITVDKKNLITDVRIG